MKIERTKNAARNVVFGMTEKMVSIILRFLVRTIFIYSLGVEYLGLNSLFTSILSVLSLAELGVGSAMEYFMYRAIAQDDSELMCALLKFYKKCYYVIGLVILVLGSIMVPFLRIFIKSGVPTDISLYVVYYINLLSTVSTYFLFAYKNSLLFAFQRNDILSKVNTILSFLQCILQICSLVVLKNYYYYLFSTIIINVIRNILVAKAADRIFPQYKSYGKLSHEITAEIKKKVSALFIYRIGFVVSNSVDTIVISAFLGLNLVGIYNNYLYIITMLTEFMQIYYKSISAGLGNSISTESVEKNYNDFLVLLFGQNWVVGWSSICLLCLYQPFIAIWIGNSYLLPFGLIICFALFYYFWKIQDIVYLYKEAAGLWTYDKFCTITGTVFNLIVNIILVQIIGLYGILISTILMNLLIIIPWGTKVLYKHYFQRSSLHYYFNILKYFIITCFAAVITYVACGIVKYQGMKSFVIQILICATLPNVLFWIVYRKSKVYLLTKQFVIKKIKTIRK